MLVRRIARPLLASIFVTGGLNELRSVEGHASMASPIAEKTARALPGNLPTDPQQLVKIDAAVKVGAGTLLALSKFPRISSILLAGSLVPTTLAAHRFWEEKDANARLQQQAHFFKNLGLLGGLILAAVDTEGKPSVGWRARRAVHDLSDATKNVAEDAADATRRGAHAVRDVALF